MKPRTPLTLLLTLVAALFAIPSGPLAQSADDVLLRQAIDLEKAKGDVKGAIEIYRKLVGSRDAKIAADAREALARLIPPAGTRTTDGQIVERTIWTGSDVPQGMNVSHDGRFTFTNQGGALAIRDLVTGTDRPLVQRQRPASQGEAAGFAVFAAFSRDGRFVAYDWRVQQGSEVYDELRVVSADAPIGVWPTPRTLIVDRATGGFSIRPTEWSPDGASVAVIIGHPTERTRQLGVVDVKTGALHVLKTVEFRSPSRLAFSPDGAYVAFDLPAGAHTAQRDIYAIHIQSGRETALVTSDDYDELAGWAADGRVLFVSDRQGTSLWAQPVANGRPIGQASMLRADVGTPVAITSGGGLIHIVRTSFPRIYTAPIDLAAARATEPPVAVRTRWPTNALPAWSPDGQSLAYLSSPRLDSSYILSIHDLTSGSVRERLLPVAGAGELRWSADGKSLVMSGADLANQRAIFTTDVQSLETTVLVRPPDGFRFVYPDLSKDATTVFYFSVANSPTADSTTYVARNTKTNVEQILFVDRKLPPGGFGALSPDRTQITRLSDDGAGVIVRDLESGKDREVFRSPVPRSLLGGPAAEWTPDGRALLIRQQQGGAPWTLWLAPIDGGQPRQMDLGVSAPAGFVRMSSTGRLAFSAGIDQRELRVIEGLVRPGITPGSK
jgi:Tol biopolymer transport system component